MDITLEDVESAIKVLTEFLKKEREAKRILRQLGIREGEARMRSMSFESFVQTAFEEVQRKQREAKAGVEEPVSEVSEEDLTRMRAIKDKIKKEGKIET